MSAFVCTPNHIATLVAYHKSAEYAGQSFDMGRAAETLMRENIRSVADRYPDCTDGDYPGASGTQQELVDEAKRLVNDAAFCAEAAAKSPVEILKLAQSLEYQSCECDDWDTTEAKKLIDSVVSGAIARLPGYDEADWSI